VCLPVPALTKVNSLEDEGIVLKAEQTEEQKKEIKKESGAEHQEVKKEKQMEPFNEPSTSSGSACPEVKQPFFSILYRFVLVLGEAQPPSPCVGSVKRQMLSVCFHVPLRMSDGSVPGLCGAQRRLGSARVEVGDRGVGSACRSVVRSVPACQPPGLYAEVTLEPVLLWGYCAVHDGPALIF